MDINREFMMAEHRFIIAVQRDDLGENAGLGALRSGYALPARAQTRISLEMGGADGRHRLR